MTGCKEQILSIPTGPKMSDPAYAEPIVFVVVEQGRLP